MAIFNSAPFVFDVSKTKHETNMNTFHKFCTCACVLLLNLACVDVMRAQNSTLGNDPSLKLHFDFDENFSSGEVLDVSSNGNNGWQFNPTNWITATNGVFGSKAAQFTYAGVITNDPPNIYNLSQYIGITNLNGIYMLTNATISVWARFDTNNDRFMSLLDCGYATPYAWSPSQASNSWSFGRYYTTYLEFVTYPIDASYPVVVVNWPDDTIGKSSGVNLSTTNFHLYSITLDCPHNQAIAYYDGQPCMTNTINLPWIRVYGTATFNSGNWLCVGAMAHDGTPQWGDDPYPHSGFFAGRMDDIRIYNRTLAAWEVQNTYLGLDSKAASKRVTARVAAAQSIQMSFDGLSNVLYQVEYRSCINAETWKPWGAAILSNGGTNSITDSMVSQGNRLYRVHPLP